MGIPVDVRATGLGGWFVVCTVREHIGRGGQVDAGLEMEMVGGRSC